MPRGEVRAPYPPRSKVDGEVWLFLFFLTMVLSALTLAGFIVGVLVQRAGLKARWVLAFAAGWLAAYVLWRRGDVRAMAETHFFIYLEMIPAFMAESVRSGRPFEVLGLGMWWQALTGLLWLGFPVGLAVSVGARMARRTQAPEWSEKATRERERVHASKLDKAKVQAATPPNLPAVLGPSMGGDLPWHVPVRDVRFKKAVPWLQLPEDTLDWPRAFIGVPGFGKTFTFERLVAIYASMGRKVIFVDGKGTDPELPRRVVQAYLAGLGPGHFVQAGLFPDVPMTIWRGEARHVVQKVLGVWTFAEQHQFFESVAETCLDLAINIPGLPPVESSAELVRRLDPHELSRLHKHHGTPATIQALDDVIKLKEWGLPGFSMRMRSLLRSLGSTLDGFWSFEDVDVAVLTVPSGQKRKDASAVMRVLLEDFLQYASLRKDPAVGSVLIFDEFSALQGGRQAAKDAVERLRSTRTAVILGAQSVEGLGGGGAGAIYEARQLLSACSGGVGLFRTPAPEEMVKLAGSVKLPSTTHNIDHWGLSDRGMVRPDTKFKVDPDEVRQFVPGELAYIFGGRASHLYVASTPIPSWAVDHAEVIMQEARRVHETRTRVRSDHQEGNHERDTKATVRPLRATQECP